MPASVTHAVQQAELATVVSNHAVPPTSHEAMPRSEYIIVDCLEKL